MQTRSVVVVVMVMVMVVITLIYTSGPLFGRA